MPLLHPAVLVIAAWFAAGCGARTDLTPEYPDASRSNVPRPEASPDMGRESSGGTEASVTKGGDAATGVTCAAVAACCANVPSNIVVTACDPLPDSEAACNDVLQAVTGYCMGVGTPCEQLAICCAGLASAAQCTRFLNANDNAMCATRLSAIAATGECPPP